MDNVFLERVAGIRERYGSLMERRRANVTLYDRACFADWLAYRREGDHEVLTIVRGYLNPTPAEAADRE